MPDSSSEKRKKLSIVEPSSKEPPKKRRKFSLFRFLFKTVGVLLLLLVGIIAFLLIRPTTIHLGFLADTIEGQVSKALRRAVSLDGDIVLVTGMVPSVRVEKVRIAQPEEFNIEEDFASLEKFETSISLLELLKRQVQIDDIAVEGLKVALATDAKGIGNWEGLAEPSQPDDAADEDAGGGIGLSFYELGQLVIEDIEITYREGSKPAETLLALESLEGSARREAGVELDMNGEFMDLPYTGKLNGGTLDALRARAEAWPLALAAKLGSSKVNLKASVPAKETKAAEDVIEFDLEIPRLDEFVEITGELPDFGSLRLAGQANKVADGRLVIPGITGNVGESPLIGNVTVDINGEIPRIEGAVEMEFLDLQVFAQDDEAEKGPAGEDTLPEAETEDVGDSIVAIAKGEAGPYMFPAVGKLELKLGEIRGMKNGAEIADLDLGIEIEQDVAKAEVGVRFAGAPLTGQLDMSRKRGKSVSFDLELLGTDAELSEIIAFYAGHNNFEGRFEKLHYRISGDGRTMADAWKKRAVNLDISAAEVVYKGGKKERKFLVKTGSMSRKGGEPGALRLEGIIGQAPFDVELSIDPAGESARDTSHILKLKGKVADVEINIGNELEAGAGLEGAEVAFSVQGESLEALDSIYELNLPPLGPYAASGKLKHEDGVIDLSDVALKIGQSNFAASCRVDTNGERPNVSLDLHAETLQLDDFIFDDWSAVESKPAKKPASPEGENAVADALEAVGEIKSLLSYESLNQVDADLKMKVGQVFSGRDRLGSGSLTASLKDSRFSVEQATLGIPGGSFTGSLLFHPKAGGSLDWHAKLKADSFELGVLARRQDPDTDFSALVNLDVDVGAKGTSFAKPRLTVSTGTFNLDVCPENLRAGVLDLWATNLVFALLPTLDPENESKVNCIIARLKLQNGVITPEALGMDLTKIRVMGEGTINLVENKYDLVLTPVPKRPQILSLELPIGIQGELDKPEISMGKLPVVRTAGRMAKNTVLFPIKLVVQDRLPEDGSDVCPCGKSPEREKED